MKCPHHLLGLGLLSQNHLVPSLELGNEVREGTGMAELRQFGDRVNGLFGSCR